MAVLPQDVGACGRQRLIWPAEAAAADGRPVTICPPGSVKVHVDTATGKVVRHSGLPDPLPDVIVLQRISSPKALASMRWMRAQGIAVVLDVDDAMWAVPRPNPAWRPWIGKGGWRVFEQACREADLVTCTTRTLASRYGSHHRVTVIPNRIPAWYLQVPRCDPGPRIGWAGSLATHPGDLAPLTNVIPRLEGLDGIDVVGPADGVADVLGHPITATGWVEWDEYPLAIAETVGVGVASLARSTFNEAKSALKPLEYAALAVPAVVSATRPYRDLARTVPTLTADSDGAWVASLNRLLGYQQEREDLGGRAREAARAHTIEAHWGDQWEAWCRAAARRAALV